MKNITIGIESSKKHKAELNDILNMFFEKFISSNKQDLFIFFTPISRKMKTFLKMNKTNSIQRCGSFSKDTLKVAVNNLMLENLTDLYITNENEDVIFNLSLNEYRNLYIEYGGEYQKISDTLKDISQLNADDSVFFKINIPYSFGLISYQRDRLPYFWQNDYSDLVNLDYSELLRKHNASDHIFDLSTSAEEDLDLFLSEVAEGDTLYVVYESVYLKKEYYYQKTYYDYGKKVDITYGVVETVHSKNELREILVKCQSGEMYFVKVFSLDSKTLFLFDKEGYWKMNFNTH